MTILVAGRFVVQKYVYCYASCMSKVQLEGTTGQDPNDRAYFHPPRWLAVACYLPYVFSQAVHD